MKKIAGSCLLAVVGSLAGLCIAEAGLRLCKGRPPAVTTDKYFYYRYIDINKKFFAYDAAKDRYFNQRHNSQPSQFARVKDRREKRVFILGESVAYFFPAAVIKERLDEVLPQYSWNIINCGMGGYDSHRIKLVAREIVDYQPDLVLLLMGNNGENPLLPLKVNQWIYNYPYLARFWTIRMMSDFLNSRQYVTTFEFNMRFRKDAEYMVRLMKRGGIPVVVGILPYNHGMIQDGIPDYGKRDFFDVWWLLGKKPERAAELFLKAGLDKRDGSWWYLGKAYENAGAVEDARRCFLENVSQGKEARKAILREVAAGERCILADFDASFALRPDKTQGAAFFRDDVHYWYDGYRLLTEELVRSIYCHNRDAGSAVLSPCGQWKHIDRPGKTSFNAANGSNAHFYEDVYHSFCYLGGKEKTDYQCELTRECLDYLYRRDRNVVVNFPDIPQMESLPEDAWKHPEGIWCGIGDLLRVKREYARALFFLQKAVKANKDNYYGYFFRGLCYYDRGDRDMAEKDFRTLRNLNRKFHWLSVEYLDSLKTL